MLQSFLLHSNRIKYKLLRNHKDNIWSCMQLLEPEKWRKAKIELDLPNLSICGRCLCNDRTGLRRWHGLLYHNTGVVVWHPCIGQLVRSRSCHCSSNCVMHGDILWKEGKRGMVEEIKYIYVYIYIWDLYISMPNLLFEIYRTTIRNMKAPMIWKVTDSWQILNQRMFL